MERDKKPKIAIVSAEDIEMLKNQFHKQSDILLNLNFFNQTAIKFFQENELIEKWNAYYTQKRDEYNAFFKLKQN